MTESAGHVQTDTSRSGVALLARVVYGMGAGVAGMLLAFFVVALWGTLLDNGEIGEALALGWWYFGGPASVIGIVLSGLLVFPFYRGRRSWGGAGAVFASNALVIAALVLLLAAWAAGVLVFAS